MASLVACGGDGPARPRAPAASAAPSDAIETMVTSGDAKLFVRVTGPADGPVLLLIHGGPGISHEYLLGIEALVPRHMRVVTYDQRSTGRSSPATEFTVANLIDDVEAIRVHLGAEQLHVLGHSWGGFVGLVYAFDRPEHVASMILLDSIPATQEQLEAGAARQHATIERLRAQGVIAGEPPPPSGDDCAPNVAWILPAYFSNPTHPRVRDFHARCSRAGGGAIALAEKYDFRTWMAEAEMPVLVMTGADDPFGVEWADELVAAFAATTPRRVVIPDCGHFPWIEAPDRFRDELAAFLPAP